MGGPPSDYIQHNNHVPQSPLYVPGQTPRQHMEPMAGGQGQGAMTSREELRDDPRYGSAQGRRGDSRGKKPSEPEVRLLHKIVP